MAVVMPLSLVMPWSWPVMLVVACVVRGFGGLAPRHPRRIRNNPYAESKGSRTAPLIERRIRASGLISSKLCCSNAKLSASLSFLLSCCVLFCLFFFLLFTRPNTTRFERDAACLCVGAAASQIQAGSSDPAFDQGGSSAAPCSSALGCSNPNQDGGGSL